MAMTSDDSAPINLVERSTPTNSIITNPIITNPFKEARESIVDSSTGRSISHSNLAKRIGVTKLSLIRLEQGTFTDPLPTVLDYFCNLGFNYLSLTDGYIQFQYDMRRSNLLYFGPDLEIDIFIKDHPFEQLRYAQGVHRNQNEVSKALCIPQATINTFERDPRSFQSVPRTIINVLPVLGYTDEQIESFCHSYRTWRDIKLNKNVIDIDSAVGRANLDVNNG